MPVRFWGKTLTFKGVEYRRQSDTDEVWHATDGSNEVLTGPEKLPLHYDKNVKIWYMYSTVGKDFFPVETRTVKAIRPDGSFRMDAYGRVITGELIKSIPQQGETCGYIENILEENDEGPVKMLKEMDLKMKRLAENETGKSITLLEHIKWFKENPTLDYDSDCILERTIRFSRMVEAYPDEANLDASTFEWARM